MGLGRLECPAPPPRSWHGSPASDAVDAAPSPRPLKSTRRPLPSTRDTLERELPLLVVAERVEVLLARELDHGRRAAHDD